MNNPFHFVVELVLDQFHSTHVSVLIEHSGEMKLFLNVASIINPRRSRHPLYIPFGS